MHAAQQFSAKVQNLKQLAPNIFQVRFQLDQPATYLAGQYGEIQINESTWLPFSLANRPNQHNLIEMHIQHFPDSANSQQLFQLLESGQINVRIATGQCVLQGADRPLTLIASGTGFAQIKALLEELSAQNWQAPIRFYWAAKNLAGLYHLELAQSFSQQLTNYTFIPVVEEAPQNWEGKQGLVTQVLAQEFAAPNSAAQLEGFICGSPNMVYAVEDLLMQQGMPAKSLLSDAHFYAPRSYTVKN